MKNEEKQYTSYHEGYRLDDEIGIALTDFISKYPVTQQPEKGNWQQLRAMANQLYANMNNHLPLHPEVLKKNIDLETGTGSTIRLRWYNLHKEQMNGSAVIYVHGGGRIAGSLDLYDQIIGEYVYRSAVPFLGVGYELAPEISGKAQAEQVFDAVQWLSTNALQLGIDKNRIAIMGDSGGGGIAAGAAIIARDRGVKLAKQILIYPMLDDRTIIPDERLLPFALWSYDNNATAWNAAIDLQHPLDRNEMTIAAPARLKNFEGLPSTYISVGDLDIFRDETLYYAMRLTGAGVPTELHIHSGAPHGFEFFMPDTTVAKRAMADHIRVIQSV